MTVNERFPSGEEIWAETSPWEVFTSRAKERADYDQRTIMTKA